MMFSVIIPTYNRRELLIRTLASVWAQRFSDFEVVVVDDGSTDGTLECLHTHAPRARVIRQANRGQGVARNLGAQEAGGDYLAFLDSDDLWFPWTLATFADVIARYHGPAILAARLVEFVDDAEAAHVRDEPVEADVFEDYLASSRNAYFVGGSMSVLRREEFVRVGGFTDRRINCEDHDLILRMGTAPGFAQILRPITLGWRRHGGGATTDCARSLAGSLHLIEEERRGAYPGGRAREVERRRIVTQHTRPTSLSCLGPGFRAKSWRLYGASFSWHMQLGRWKYLLGFPVRALLS
jgi:glycosyltransferase involved in cell wall biosynthesis